MRVNVNSKKHQRGSLATLKDFVESALGAGGECPRWAALGWAGGRDFLRVQMSIS